MQPTIQNGKVASIWIVTKHPLVARYLRDVLARDPMMRPNWVQAAIPAQNELGAHPVFVFDNSALETPVAGYVQNLNRIIDVKFIVLGYRLDVKSVCQLRYLGIHGFLTYDQVNESLLPAVRAVQSGGTWVDSRVLQKYMRLSKRDKNSLISPADDGLTAREEEILHFTQQRLSNKEIASLLNIEVSTVKFHLSNIFAKLQIASRSDLWHNYMPRVATLPFAKNGRSATVVNGKGTEFRADAN